MFQKNYFMQKKKKKKKNPTLNFIWEIQLSDLEKGGEKQTNKQQKQYFMIPRNISKTAE